MSQKLFWISKKTAWGCGEKAITYGMEITGKIPDSDIPSLKKTGEIGTIEAATPEGVKVDRAYEKLFDEAKEQGEKMQELKAAFSQVVETLKQSTIKKEDKTALLEMLEGLQ